MLTLSEDEIFLYSVSNETRHSVTKEVELKKPQIKALFEISRYKGKSDVLIGCVFISNSEFSCTLILIFEMHCGNNWSGLSEYSIGVDL